MVCWSDEISEFSSKSDRSEIEKKLSVNPDMNELWVIKIFASEISDFLSEFEEIKEFSDSLDILLLKIHLSGIFGMLTCLTLLRVLERLRVFKLAKTGVVQKINSSEISELISWRLDPRLINESDGYYKIEEIKYKSIII